MPLWMAVWFICIFLVLFTYYLIRWTIQRRSSHMENTHANNKE